ncbi:MAG: peptidoglycan -binding protein [Elsteraceae bacterium]
MALGRRTQSRSLDFWPGFVDALATLLIVIIFLILVFVLAQFYLGQALTGRDTALARLDAQLAQLSEQLAMERRATADLRANVTRLNADLQASISARDQSAARLAAVLGERDAAVGKAADAEARLSVETQRFLELQADRNRLAAALAAADARAADSTDRLAVAQGERDRLSLGLADALATRERLTQDIAALSKVRADLEARVTELAASGEAQLRDLTAERDRAKALVDRLSTAEERTALAQKELADLLAVNASRAATEIEAQARIDALNQQIMGLRDQLARVMAALDLAESLGRDRDAQILDLGRRLNVALAAKVEELARYRSEFFGRLRELLGDRSDIRIVGDRFVLQAEVLFDPGSAELGAAGREQLVRLAGSMRGLLTQIPNDLNWVLRVDGHTDRVPIRNAQFPSNWELSTARALSVTRFLIEQGIPPDRLAAAGFGEFQPIDPGTDEASRRRNRRIELKLTDR